MSVGVLNGTSMNRGFDGLFETGSLIASEFSVDARKRASVAADKSIVTLHGV